PIVYVSTDTPATSSHTLSLHDALPIYQRPQFEQGVLQTVDLLPVTQWRTVHEDPSAAWRTTLEKTLSMALAEDAEAVASALSMLDRKSTRLNSSHVKISYAVFCLKRKI